MTKSGSGGVVFLWWNQQPAGSAVVERTSTISLGMSTSVSDDSSSSTTTANDSVSPSLTLLVSSLTRKEELVGYHNKNNEIGRISRLNIAQCSLWDLLVGDVGYATGLAMNRSKLRSRRNATSVCRCMTWSRQSDVSPSSSITSPCHTTRTSGFCRRRSSDTGSSLVSSSDTMMPCWFRAMTSTLPGTLTSCTRCSTAVTPWPTSADCSTTTTAWTTAALGPRSKTDTRGRDSCGRRRTENTSLWLERCIAASSLTVDCLTSPRSFRHHARTGYNWSPARSNHARCLSTSTNSGDRSLCRDFPKELTTVALLHHTGPFVKCSQFYFSIHSTTFGSLHFWTVVQNNWLIVEHAHIQ